jgi:membrane protein
MESLIHGAKHHVDTVVWGADLRELRGWSRTGVKALRVTYVIIRDLLGGELNLRAMSLVYTTLLSVVPLLAVSFSVLKAFGVHNQVAPLLEEFLRPLGPKGIELAGDVVGFVENVNVGVLGAVSLALLIYTVVSLMHKVELALNFVWHIESLRSFARRASNFLSVILIGPVLVFSALGITTALTSTEFVQWFLRIEPFGSLMVTATKVAPYLLVWIAFTFIYLFVPNTKVRFRSAALGGLVAGILWQTTSWGFTQFIASSGRHTAIYSGFAILILVLIWLYLNWLVLLVGAQIAFYVQNPHYLTQQPLRLALSNRLKECLSLSVMYMVACNHVYHRPPWTLEGLTRQLDLPAEPMEYVLTLLHEQSYVRKTADDPAGFLPARDLASVEVRQLVRDVRQAEESRFLNEGCLAVPRRVLDLSAETRTAVDRELGTVTIRDLVPDDAEDALTAVPTDPDSARQL